VYKVVRQESLIAESFKSSHMKETILLPLVHKDIWSKTAGRNILELTLERNPSAVPNALNHFSSYVR